MAFQVDVESSAMRSSAITSSGEIFWVWFWTMSQQWRDGNEYIYIWIHGIEWCTHITTSVSAIIGLSPAPMFHYVSIYQTLWTFAWKSPFGILASMGSWLLAMLVRWFMRWCVPHETVPHETESQSQRFPTCTDKVKFGCYLKKGSSLPLEKSKTTSARQRCRSGTITFRDASAYLCPFTNFTTRGGTSGGGCEPAAPPVSGWLFQDADVATAPTAVATQLAPTASEPTMLEYAQVGLLQRQWLIW